MKKHFLRILTVLAMVCLGVGVLAACGGDPEEPPAPATKYTLSYDLDGGEGTTPTGGSYEAGATVTAAADTGFTKESYTFGGWLDGTTQIAAGSTFTMPAHNVTLKADWQLSDPYVGVWSYTDNTEGEHIVVLEVGPEETVGEETFRYFIMYTTGEHGGYFGLHAKLIPDENGVCSILNPWSSDGSTYEVTLAEGEVAFAYISDAGTQDIPVERVSDLPEEPDFDGTWYFGETPDEEYIVFDGAAATLYETGTSTREFDVVYFADCALATPKDAADDDDDVPLTFLIKDDTIYMLESGAIGSQDEPSVPAKYTVTYFLGDHAAEDATIPTQAPVTAGTDITLPAAPAAATGWKFDGWYVGDDKIGDAAGSYTVNDNVSILAHWVAVYALSWNKGEISGEPTGIPVEGEYTAGEEIPIPEDPTYEGYVFDGWVAQYLYVYGEGPDDNYWTEIQGNEGLSYRFFHDVSEKESNAFTEYLSTFTMRDCEIHMVAHWKSIYTVTYNFGEGYGGSTALYSPAKVVERDSYTLEDAPVWDGHHFVCWEYTLEGVAMRLADGGEISSVITNVTLTAVWTEKEQFTITFKVKNEVLKTLTITPGETLAGKEIPTDEDVNAKLDPDLDTYYGSWQLVVEDEVTDIDISTYFPVDDCTFQANVETYTEPEDVEYPTVKLYAGEEGGAETFDVPKDLSWLRYRAAGPSDMGGGEWTLKVPTENPFTENGEKEITDWYAYTLIDPYGGDETERTSLSVFATDGWVSLNVLFGNPESGALPNEELKIYADFSNGPKAEPAEAPEIEIHAVEESKISDGWWSSTTIADHGITATKNEEHWEITLPAGDSLPGGATAPEGMKFGYWCYYDTAFAPKQIEAGKVTLYVDAGDCLSAKNDVFKFYIVWVSASEPAPETKYSVTFDKNLNGAEEEVTGMPTDATDVPAGEYSIPDQTPSRKGYNFLGWTLTADGEGTVYKYGTNHDKVTINDADITLYAKWEPASEPAPETKQYTFNYYKDAADDYEGQETVGTKTVEYADGVSLKNEDILASSGVTKADYDFAGWFYKKGDEEKALDETFVVSDYGATTINVYAKWTLKATISVENITATAYTDNKPPYVYPEKLKEGEILTLTSENMQFSDKENSVNIEWRGITFYLTDGAPVAGAISGNWAMLLYNNFINGTNAADGKLNAENALHFTIVNDYIGFPDTDYWWVESLREIMTKGTNISLKAVLDFSTKTRIMVEYTLTATFKAWHSNGGEPAQATQYDTEDTKAFVSRYYITPASGNTLASEYTVAIGGEKASVASVTLARTAHTHDYGSGVYCTECGAINPEHEHAYTNGLCACGAISASTDGFTAVTWSKATTGFLADGEKYDVPTTLEAGHKMYLLGTQTSNIAAGGWANWHNICWELRDNAAVGNGYTGRTDNYGWSFGTSPFSNWNAPGNPGQQPTGTSANVKLATCAAHNNKAYADAFHADVFRQIVKNANWYLEIDYTNNAHVLVTLVMSAIDGPCQGATYTCQVQINCNTAGNPSAIKVDIGADVNVTYSVTGYKVV